MLTKEQLTKAKNQWNSQRHSALKRLDKNKNQIQWKLTFDEWLDIWIQSGHYFERGRKIGQYCMCRYNDIGDYEPGNVFIDLASNNSAVAMDAAHTPESRHKVADALRGKKRDPKIFVKIKITRALKPKKIKPPKVKVAKPKVNHPAWNKGIPHTPETKEKIRQSNLGKHHTEEARAKISLAHKGKPKSESMKEKLRQIRTGMRFGPRDQSIKDAAKTPIHTPDGVMLGIVQVATFYNVCKRTVSHWMDKKPTEFYRL